jgi:hypothetical protein
MTAGAPDTQDRHKQFTSRKLDWLTAIGHDPKVKPWAFKIVFWISNHFDAERGTAFISDETLSAESGSPERTVRRARKQLAEADWLQWQHTRSANLYIPKFERVPAMLDKLKKLRQDRRAKYRADNSHPAKLGRPTRPNLAESTRPNLAGNHLSTHLTEHLREEGKSKAHSDECAPRRSPANKLAIFERQLKERGLSAEEFQEGIALCVQIFNDFNQPEHTWNRAARLLEQYAPDNEGAE